MPFVFARADRPFIRSGLPMPIGMAVTFAATGGGLVFNGAWNRYFRAFDNATGEVNWTAASDHQWIIKHPVSASFDGAEGGAEAPRP
jgi:hypothetical protein